MRASYILGRKWVGRGVLIFALAILILASTWTAGKMSGSGVFLPFIFADYKVCSIAPELHSPVNGTIIGSLAPLFTGDAGSDPSGKSVYIEISLDQKFEHIVRTLAANTGTGNFSARSTENLLPGATYYWRAQLVCARNSSPFSAAQTFATISLVDLPAAAKLISPESAVTGLAIPVEFTWETVAEAEEYLLYFRPTGPHGWYFNSTDKTSLLRTLLKGTAYEWYVVARSAAGYGTASETRTLTTSP